MNIRTPREVGLDIDTVLVDSIEQGLSGSFEVVDTSSIFDGFVDRKVVLSLY